MTKKHNFRSQHALDSFSDHMELWDTPLFESESFVALPSVGAFIEGWLLIVPRTELLSYGFLPESLWDEAEAFVSEVCARVEAKYGPVALFEHGPKNLRSAIGCGVDYAHFHIVPTQHDLREQAARSYPQLKWNRCTSIRSLQHPQTRSNGYWALLQKSFSESCWVAESPAENPPNQLFRRLLATKVGLNQESFDWRKKLGEQQIKSTIRTLSQVPAFV